MPPLVSVIIPTHNRAGYLRQSLASALAQTYHDIEIVVVDNCSTDGTPDVVAELAGNDDRVRYVRNDADLTMTENFARSVEMAGGDLIKFLMDDDWLRADAVERLARPMIDHPEVVLATSRRQRVDQAGSLLPDSVSTVPVTSVDAVLDGRDFGNLLLTRAINCLGEPTTVLFRRSLAGSPEQMFTLGRNPYTRVVDVVLWLRLLCQGPAVYLTEPLSVFRLHGENLSHEVGVAVLEWLRMSDEAPAFGFLSEPSQQAAALASFVTRAGESLPAMGDQAAAVAQAVEEAGLRLGALSGEPEPSRTTSELRRALPAPHDMRSFALRSPGDVAPLVTSLGALLVRLAGGYPAGTGPVAADTAWAIADVGACLRHLGDPGGPSVRAGTA